MVSQGDAIRLAGNLPLVGGIALATKIDVTLIAVLSLQSFQPGTQVALAAYDPGGCDEDFLQFRELAAGGRRVLPCGAGRASEASGRCRKRERERNQEYPSRRGADVANVHRWVSHMVGDLHHSPPAVRKQFRIVLGREVHVAPVLDASLTTLNKSLRRLRGRVGGLQATASLALSAARVPLSEDRRAALPSSLGFRGQLACHAGAICSQLCR